VDQQLQALELHDQVLAAPPHAERGAAGELGQGRIVRLQHVDSWREGRFDSGARDRRADTPRGDLDLG
jgi:hypothetical protein